jgi:hypothetical protein
MIILFYLLNFAIHQIRQGNKDYHAEYIALAKIGLNQSLFITSGYFPTDTFTNIVNMASYLQEYTWVEQFVKTYSEQLEPKNRAITTNLALARVRFEQKKFSETIDLIRQMPHRNMAFSLNIRILLARSYYEEKKPTDFMLDFCKTLYLYVYRNKRIGDDLKTSTNNFIDILRGLVNGKPKEQIVKELKTKEGLILCYDWIKAKIEERKSS